MSLDHIPPGLVALRSEAARLTCARRRLHAGFVTKPVPLVGFITKTNQKSERFDNDGWVNASEDVTILYSSVSDNKTSKCMKQKLILLQGEADKPTAVVGNLSTTFSCNDRTNTQKLTKDVAELSDTINQLDLIAFIGRTLSTM